MLKDSNQPNAIFIVNLMSICENSLQFPRFLFQESGVVILRNGGLDHEDDDEGVDEEVESDSDSGLGGSVPPCSVTFIGANVSTGKSSMRSKSRDKKVSHILSFKILTKDK